MTMKIKLPVFAILLILVFNLALADKSVFFRDSLDEGEIKAYEVENGMYILKLEIVSDRVNVAKFRLNNELSDSIKEGGSYIFNDGSEIVIKAIVPNEAADGEDYAEFYFYGSGENPIEVNFSSGNVDFKECDFDGKCINETMEKCCYDCGCGVDYECKDNMCELSRKCADNDDCDDDNACTSDSCYKNKCVHKKTEGCDLNKKCMGYGEVYKVSGVLSYCSFKNRWEEQKHNDEPCMNNYECLSGLCLDNICVSPKTRKTKGFVLSLIIIIVLLIIVLINIKKLDFKRITRKFRR